MKTGEVYSLQAVESWCNACVRAYGGPWTPDDLAGIGSKVDVFNDILLAKGNVDVMGKFDWIALVLCTYVCGLTVTGEVKDVSQSHLRSLLQTCQSICKYGLTTLAEC
jgi:hypothetical protein